MNIGAWPLDEERQLTNFHVQCRERASNDNDQLFWTQALLQTSTYEEQRYRQIASNACQRIIQQQEESSLKTPSRLPSTIALSLSETSTRQTSSKNHSTPKTVPLSISTRKKSSHTRFSCYIKSHHHIKNRSKSIRKPLPTNVLPKNNNNHRPKLSNVSTRKPIIKLSNECREKLCQKCSRLLQTSSTHSSSNLLCSRCSNSICNSSKSRLPLNRTEENELRQIIEIVIEEFQDHFGHALNLSIKQMTQHLLSNINLFYQHYQQEFEQLTKTYRLAFLERFLQLMKKISQSNKPSISTRNSITHPPDILSMSSLSGSIISEKDRSETITQLRTPSDSLSLSTRSNPSIILTEKKYYPIQHSSSKKTFTINRTGLRKNSSRQLIDAYRFRDTLRMNQTQFSSPRPKIR